MYHTKDWYNIMSKLLGINVDDKSQKEIYYIVKTLNLQALSEKSLADLRNLPRFVREFLIENPMETKNITDDDVSFLKEYYSHPVKNHEHEIGNYIKRRLIIESKKKSLTKDNFIDVIIDGLKEGLDVTCKYTGYDSVYFEKITDVSTHDTELDMLLWLYKGCYPIELNIELKGK